MKKTYLYFLGLFVCCFIKAQVGIGTPNPSPTAVLELSSNNKGLFLNKVALTATDVAAPFSEHIAGIWVFNTATSATGSKKVIPGLYYNNGSSWMLMSETRAGIGDIKASVKTTDHDGWYLLNGRSVSTLPAIAKAHAAILGITTLPNSLGRFFKGKTNAESFAATGGRLANKLTIQNLPPFKISGTTNTTGQHSHTGIIDNTGTVRLRSALANTTGVDHSSFSRQTSQDGNHSHSISIPIGGSSQDISLIPRSFTVQHFIFLGQL